GAAGIAVAAGGIQLFRAIAPAETPRLQEVSVDGTLLWFALASSFVSGLVLGWIPAHRAARMAPNQLFQQPSSGIGRRLRFGSALVITEVALAFVLLIGSTLMIQTVTRLLRQDPGFRTDHLLTLDLPQKTKWFEHASE